MEIIIKVVQVVMKAIIYQKIFQKEKDAKYVVLI
jgi:hypothetical protein